MQSSVQSPKIALIVDEDILEILACWLIFELGEMEEHSVEDDYSDLPKGTCIKYRLLANKRYLKLKEFEKTLDIIFEQIDYPNCKRIYKEQTL